MSGIETPGTGRRVAACEVMERCSSRPGAGATRAGLAAMPTLLLAAVLLTACGQKGPLVLPDQATGTEPTSGAAEDEEEEDDQQAPGGDGRVAPNGGDDGR